MNPVSIPAHFDGERILLDEPIELEPKTRLMVTILPREDEERDAWLRASAGTLPTLTTESEMNMPSTQLKS